MLFSWLQMTANQSQSASKKAGSRQGLTPPLPFTAGLCVYDCLTGAYCSPGAGHIAASCQITRSGVVLRTAGQLGPRRSLGETMGKKPRKKLTKSTPNPNLPAVKKFFTLLGTGTTSAADISSILKLFSPDSSGAPPTSPNVGIAGSGPQFVGQKAISILFTQLTTSFPGITILPVSNAVYCFSADGNTITVQTTVDTGAYMQPWFGGGSAAYSQPLSDLKPNKKNTSTVPAYAAFTFDTNNLIQNLAVFMDRWQMAADLWNKTDPFPVPK
jgi:hypothetical protein